MLRKIFTVALCLGLPGVSFAEQWKILGPRPLGMGGAFVAMAEGAIAQYWNPAGLAQDATNSKWGLQIPIGANAAFTGGVLNDANALNSLSSQISAIQTAQKNRTALDASNIAAFYQALATIKDMDQPGKGALADIEGGANFKIGKLAFSLDNYTSIGASPFVDTVNIGLGQINGQGGTGVTFAGSNPGSLNNAADTSAAATITGAVSQATVNNLDTLTGGALTAAGITNPTQLGNALANLANTNGQTPAQIQSAANQIAQNAGAAAPIIAAAATGGAYTNNNTNLTVKGGSFSELAMGYGHTFFLPGLLVGGNIKMIQGRVGYDRVNVVQNDSGGTKSLSHFKDNIATSYAPGIDLGALWQADQLFPIVPWNLRAGIVGRNLNNPKFSQPAVATNNGESSLYAENGQIRMGVAATPLRFWNIAADLDLTNNLTPVSGYYSRQFGLGTEVNVFNRTWINIPLRVGLMKNLAVDNSPLTYTAGFGINLLHFMIDAGGAISSDETQIKSGQKIPSNASASIQLGFMF